MAWWLETNDGQLCKQWGDTAGIRAGIIINIYVLSYGGSPRLLPVSRMAICAQKMNLEQLRENDVRKHILQ